MLKTFSWPLSILDSELMNMYEAMITWEWKGQPLTELPSQVLRRR